MTTDPAGMGEVMARVEKLAAEREHFAEHSEANRDDWYATMPPELSEAAIQEATDLRALLAHLSRQEEEIKGLRDDHHRRGVKIIEFTEIAGAHLCRAEAAESALSSLRGAVGKVVVAGRAAVTFYDRADLPHMPGEAKVLDDLSSALSELESQCPAVAESKRREDAPSSATGSDGGAR